MDPDKRNVTAIRLRGEKSDGLFLPISALNYCYTHGDASIELHAGDVIDGLVNGYEICCKYIPRSSTRSGTVTAGNRTRKKKVPIAPLFAEHADTEQLAYNLSAFKPGDEIEITLKMHGTSGRTGYLPTLKGYKDNIFRRAINKLRMGLKVRKNWGANGRDALYHSLKHGEPIYDYGYVSGTRRVVLDTYEGGFYGDNQFREQHSKIFEGKLMKGETVYYEIVGFTTSGQPIMGDADNRKTKDKEFIKQYGETTRFSYGCEPDASTTFYHGKDGMFPITKKVVPQSDIYVYRMTMTNEDGFVVEYTPDFMRYRCEQMGVKTVPVLWKETIPSYELLPKAKLEDEVDWTAGDWVKRIAELFYDGPDPIGKTHIREGVVVRIVNRPKFTAYKHKNYDFKVLSGIAIAAAEESGATDTMDPDLLAEM
jgi:hypothetical protein